MKTQTVVIPFEGEDASLEIPASWEVIAEVTPRPAPPLDDLPAALRAGLDDPLGAEPLGRQDLSGKRILLAVDDHGRPTPTHRFLPALVAYLEEHGARRDDMTVIFALGIHRDMTDEEAAAKLGGLDGQGLRWVNHRPGDRDAHVDLGTTSRGTPVLLNRNLAEADLILCVGLVEPHLLLGFGGGLKMILPGLAHADTIQRNHMQGVTPAQYNYIGHTESPMRLDLEEAASMLEKPIFLVNVVLNERLEVSRVVCGDPVKAHRAGVEAAWDINARPVPGLADVAIVSSHPMNADLRQGMKSIGNVERSVRDKGLIIGLLECKAGIGDISLPPKALPNGLLRFILRRLGRKRVLWFIDKVKKDAGVEERFMAHFSMQVVREKKILVHSRRLPPETGRKMGLFEQHGDLASLTRAAARYAPARARVLVYPHGGVTFPVLP